ncbi:integrase core domain-containing protein [Azotobacter beijerinckii]|uniref:Integrase core domain-containing protein n=1 Tax=Azotobacter beijerinckii TaxID=170623 RepID=A0A1I4HUT9_9GAMM|nr:Integrase core domain-containing protein [Azotobacter beijerinckii]
MRNVVYSKKTITALDDLHRFVVGWVDSESKKLTLKTVRKWRGCNTVENEPMGAPRSTSLTPLQEAAARVFRQKTLLPLDDGLHALQRTTPTLTRSSLHRLFLRYGIEHRLTKPIHLLTNGQVERMNRTIKDVTTRAFHYRSFEELRAHLKDYLRAYSSARPLRALKGHTPTGFILEQWHKDPQHFKDDPGHYFPGANT